MKRGRVSGFTSTSVKDVLARVVGAQPLAGSARLEPPQALTAVLRDLLDDGSTLRLAPPRDGADDPPTLLGVVRLLWAWHQGLDETCSEGRLQAFLSSQDLQSDDDTRKRVGLTARSLRDALRTNAELRRDVMKAPSRERSTLADPIANASNLNAQSFEPENLRRIGRSFVTQHWLPAVRRAVGAKEAGRPRILRIIADGGEGKSCALGELYRRLREEQDIRPIAVDSSLVGVSAEQRDFDVALGGALIPGKSLLTLVEESDPARPTVLVVDALDALLASASAAAALATTLLRVSSHATVVFVCRSHEYEQYLAGTPLHRTSVPLGIDRFSPEEICAAASAFAEHTHFGDAPGSDARAAEFGQRVVRLAESSVRNRDLLTKPLLLSLLCVSSALTLELPSGDITSTDIFDRYWRHAVDRRTRLHGATARERVEACLFIGRALHVSDRAVLAETDLPAHLELATSDLLSSGVLVRAHGLLRFHHEAMLEYAQARWLLTAEGSPVLDEVIERLGRQAGATRSRTWNVLRHVLTMVDVSRFEVLAARLPLTDPMVMRVAASAAVTRANADVDPYTFEKAAQVSKGAAREMIQAFGEVSKELAPQVASIALSHVGGEALDVSNPAARLEGLLVGRGWADVALVAQVLEKIASSSLVAVDREGQFGRFLASVGRESASPDVRRHLRARLSSFGPNIRASVVNLHPPGLDEAEARELIDAVSASPDLDLAACYARLSEALGNDAPPYPAASAQPAPTWLPPDESWRKCWLRAIGIATGRCGSLRTLVSDFVARKATPPFAAHDVGEMVLGVLHGGFERTLVELLTGEPPPVAAQAAGLRPVLEALAEKAGMAEPLVNWFLPVLASKPEGHARFIALASRESSVARALLREHWSRLSARVRIELVRNFSDAVGGVAREMAPRIAPTSPEELELACLLASDDANRLLLIRELLKLACGTSEKAALRASFAAKNLLVTMPLPVQLSEMASSPHVGVRMRLAEIAQSHVQDLPDDELIRLMTLLDDKATHEKTLYVAHLWIQAHGRCPDVVRERVFSVLGMVLDGGRTGSKQLLQAIRSMFSRTDARAGLRDRERLVRFLTEVDLGAIHDGRSEGVALAVAVGASLPGILDEVLAAGVRHEANALALARAFFQRDKSDPRLDTLTSEFPAVRDLLDRLRVERIGSRSLG